MTPRKISQQLSCRIFNENTGFDTAVIEHITATDLMSEALVEEEENMLLITALNTEQTIRTANIIDAVGVLLVNNKTPQPGMVRLAVEFDLALMSTGDSMFRTCIRAGQILNSPDD